VTILSIHQPEHCPWIGYFYKIKKSNIHVVLDDVQFERNNWQNRNRIKDKQGNLFWITISTKSTGRLNTLINEKEIVLDKKWQNLYLNRLEHCYRNEKYFAEVFSLMDKFIRKNDGSLVNLNMSIINYILAILEIDTKIIYSSDINHLGQKNDLLISICQEINATTYLSGTGAKGYLKEKDFHAANINIKYVDSPWHWPDGKIVSIIDQLFIEGPIGLKSYFDQVTS
jgi:hypothetical protein